MKTEYRQVHLQYSNGDAEVCWIPAQFAIAGKFIEIDGIGSGTVVTVYDPPRTKEEIDINRTFPMRKATDI